MKKGKIILFVLIICVINLFSGCIRISYPNINGVLSLVKQTRLKDSKFSEKNKGFTCTGISFDKKEKVFYIGNCGKIQPEEKNYNATIIKMSDDFSRIIEEISIYKIFPEMSDIQGIIVDSKDNTLWFCSFGENKVRHISKEGKDLGSFDIVSPTGIAYESKSDTLWVLTYSSLINVDKRGNILKETKVSIKGQDQIYLDEEKNAIFFTAGLNYYGENYVYKTDLSTMKTALCYILKDSYSVEGIYINKNSIFILNDGYYHKAKDPFNIINEYRIN